MTVINVIVLFTYHDRWKTAYQYMNSQILLMLHHPSKLFYLEIDELNYMSDSKLYVFHMINNIFFNFCEDDITQ